MARVTAANTLCQGCAVTICPRVDGDPDPHLLDLERDMMSTCLDHEPGTRTLHE